MNFRTTILLLVVLIAAAALYFVTTSGESPQDTVKSEPSDEAGKKLFDLTSASVNKVAVTPASGERMVFDRVGTSEWRLVEPVKAPAEAYKVDELVREVLELRTTGGADPAGKGLDQPQYVVELTDKDNRVTKLNVGGRSAVGNILYVRPEGQDQAEVVSASIVEQLEKPASDYRKPRLLNVTNDKITAVSIEHGDKTLKLEKSAVDWQIVEPKKMPGDSGQISSLLSSITGLNAVKFVAEEAKDIEKYGLNQPQMTVSLTTAPPEMQPTTKPVGGGDTTTIKFGRPQDVLKKNVYAIASESGPVVTVAASDLETLKKTPLELRDRDVLDIDPNAVSRLSISTEKSATTQPTTQPASKRQVVLERRSEVTQAGPPVPAATKPASTNPTTTTAPAATQPSQPETKWVVASDPKGDANDTNVQALLDALRPLRAEKFLETFPTTQAAPAGTYVLKISTRSWSDEPAKQHELKITDPGGEAKLIGQLGELAFELDRGILEKLTADFTAPKVAPAGPELPQLPAVGPEPDSAPVAPPGR